MRKTANQAKKIKKIRLQIRIIKIKKVLWHLKKGRCKNRPRSQPQMRISQRNKESK